MPTQLPKHLPAKLKQIRSSMELGQEQLVARLGCAKGLNVYPAKISQYENGRTAPPLQVLLSYARLVGVSVDLLIDDDVPVTAIADAAEGLSFEKASAPQPAATRGGGRRHRRPRKR